MSDDDVRGRAAAAEDRSVIGGSAVGGGSSQASSGAFDTVGGGDLGGPGSRDPGDSAGDLRPESANTDGGGDTTDLDRQAAERLAAQVFGGASGGDGDER
jgi:hypothetical protein